ncbi:hypothetical protein CROQUDRAFT_47360 [Cronartium quercuum f. sp. fusiforme G11]|uniref:Uncharacterized protein n=1 Tax=Cronartium quercuum f. sp. fusiforme G11 TaxID=708437 RepID=A0A9P6TA88_9BASI|nr:hypothetical protein CROQUDRAFT_47360 [Cronartium quercuum f. sp. fusiforme G11]
MSSPSSPSQAPSSIPLAGTGVHGLKRSRDAHPVDQQTDLAVERQSNETGLAPVSPNQAGHPPTPLAKKGRRLSKNSMDEQTSPPPTNLSKGTTQSHTPSNEGSDHGRSRMVTPEATEVKSVRKKVEGMGVENDQDQAHEKPEDETMLSEQASDEQLKTCTTSKSDALPASWASYAHSSSPFALHAPSTNVSIFTNPDQPSKSTSVPPSTNTSARAFAGPHKSSSSGLHAPQPNALGGPSSLSSASPNFPTSSDFFLKGKRNNWLGNSSTEPESDTSTQNKKPKLPDTTTTNITGFEAYSGSKPTSLKPAALARLNNNASLQMPSLTAPHLNVGRPQSAASSVCAVNGDTEESSPPLSPSSSIKPTPSPLGFSAFANSSSFGNSAVNGSSSSSTSVFDQPILSTEIGEESLIGKKKTHLALSADLSEEDRHSGFGAKECEIL